MSKLMIGVFLGVFAGALIYEIINKRNPELFEKVRDKAAGKIDEYLEMPEVQEA